MTRNYYSSRKTLSSLSVGDLYSRTYSLFQFFRKKDYFIEKTGISRTDSSKSLYHESNIYIGFAAFPMDEWDSSHIEPSRIFDVIEFLWDRVSKPGQYGELSSDSGISWGYYSYDETAAKNEFREAANVILAGWGPGFELSENGEVQEMGTHGLALIFKADIEPFDEINVDSKVRSALAKWRGRDSTISDKKEAIRIMADVFEYLKKSAQLESVLSRKDSSDLFNIANNFEIRHHNPDQKTQYDKAIWHAWMFHFYLATYHATVRMILKARSAKQTATKTAIRR